MPYLSWEKSSVVRLCAAECIKSLAYRCKPWICELLSLFLNATTVSHAELASMKPMKIFFAGDGEKGKEENNAEIESVKNLYSTLIIQSTCLSCLLHCAEEELAGVPLDIVNAAMVAAKSMCRLNEDDETGGFGQSPEIGAKVKEIKHEKEPELYVKRQAGWIIIQGLLGIGNWISGHIPTLLKLWNATFDKNSCVLADEKTPIDTLLQEFHVKREALASLRELIVNYKALLLPPIIKHLGAILSNCAEYLFGNTLREPKKKLFELVPIEYSQMKAVFYINKMQY